MLDIAVENKIYIQREKERELNKQIKIDKQEGEQKKMVEMLTTKRRSFSFSLNKQNIKKPSI